MTRMGNELHQGHIEHPPQSAPGFLDSQNTLIFSPWARRGDAPGIFPVSLLLPGVQPANFFETGGRVELFRQVLDGVLVGPTFYAMERWYDSNAVPQTNIFNPCCFIIPGSPDLNRQDFIWSPGATLFLPDFFAHQVGLKIEYQYIRDHSNVPTFAVRDRIGDLRVVPTASFVDNMVTASLVGRFCVIRSIKLKLSVHRASNGWGQECVGWK